MKRNRIVINFENLRRSPGKKRSGFLPVLVIIAVVLVVLVGGAILGGYLWWRHFQSSPAYSLALLADAAQRKDTATVDSLLDSEKVTDDFVAQARERAAGSALSALWPSQLDSVMASLSPDLKQTVHDEIIKELQRLTEPAAGKPLVLVALAVTRFADIKQENNTAHASVKLKDEEFKLTMQSEGNRWRITAVQDDKLAKLLADAVTKSMASTGTKAQEEVNKQLENLKKKVK
jgi:uncharacterized membrane protein